MLMHFANKKTEEHLMKHMHFFFFLCLLIECRVLVRNANICYQDTSFYGSKYYHSIKNTFLNCHYL